jgi:hypothetical protein
MSPEEAGYVPLGKACGIYKEITGCGLTITQLDAQLNYFTHLRRFLVKGNGELAKAPWVDRRRFEYFVRTRKALNASGKPEVIFAKPES